MKEADDALEVIATGDLTQPIAADGRDEIGHLKGSLEATRTKLLDIATSVTDATNTLSTAAEELSAITRQSDENARVQTTETGNAVRSMEEIDGAITEVSNSASDTATTAHQANSEANNCRKSVDDSVNGMQQLSSNLGIGINGHRRS